MSKLFDACFSILLGHEKGFVNDPRDPGGATNFGVSLRFLKSTGLLYDQNHDGVVDVADILLLTAPAAQKIYEARFWTPIQGDRLPPALALLVFDSAVNNGTEQAVRWLQRVAGVYEDGRLGPASMAAVAQLAPAAAATAFHAIRVYQHTRMQNWPDAGRGWAIRLAALPFQAWALEGTMAAT